MYKDGVTSDGNLANSEMGFALQTFINGQNSLRPYKIIS